MREDEIAAASMGIDLVQTKLLAFALGASFSGFAGALCASMLQFIDPFQFDFSISIMVLAMVILGGIGNIWGVMFGRHRAGLVRPRSRRSLAPGCGASGATIGFELAGDDRPAQLEVMIFGLALVLLMLLRPEGIFPSAQRRAELHGA